MVSDVVRVKHDCYRLVGRLPGLVQNLNLAVSWLVTPNTGTALAESLAQGSRVVTGSVADSFEDEFVAGLKRRDVYAASFFDGAAVAAE